MPDVTIDSKLESLVTSLGALRIATSVDDPHYETIRKQYQLASDRLSDVIGTSIDDANEYYKAFDQGVKSALAAIEEATERIEEVAKAVRMVAQVLEVTAKIMGKLVA